MTATIEQDRDDVRRLLLEAESHIRKSDSEAADAATTSAEKIVERRAADGSLPDVLSPLLDDAEAERVRFGAASFLMSRGHSDLAVPVLESIDVPEARIVLDYWQGQQNT